MFIEAWGVQNSPLTDIVKWNHYDQIIYLKAVKKGQPIQAAHLYITGMVCFLSYLTDFRYFPLKIVFQKLLDTVRTGQK